MGVVTFLKVLSQTGQMNKDFVSSESGMAESTVLISGLLTGTADKSD